jgi:23S rRNA (cytosine1962-C5)-methyltransferase
LGDADKVISVDSSAAAVAACDEHVQMNVPSFVERHESVVGDAWDYLRLGNSRFDMIILDPPTLTGDKTSMERAQKAYRDLHEAALRRLRKGGLLLTCSCSSRISDAMFSSLVQETAVGNGHVLCQLESLAQPLDHPTRNKFPEGRYLKVMLYGSR